MSVRKCWKPAPIALGIALILPSGCARVGSEHGACPPVVSYSTADQARAATELETLPEGAVLVRMLSDYAVMRNQARACR